MYKNIFIIKNIKNYILTIIFKKVDIKYLEQIDNIFATPTQNIINK